MQSLQSRNTREGKSEVQGGDRGRYSFSSANRTKRKKFVLDGHRAHARALPRRSRKVTHRSWN